MIVKIGKMRDIVENCYVSASCNCTPTCVDWGKNNLICYGSCHAVFIYDLHEGGGRVVHVLNKHTNRVNSVRWIRGRNLETELVSGSADGKAIVWSLKGDTYVPFVLAGHEDNVNFVDALYKNDLTVVVTASMDSTIKIWTSRINSEFSLSQNIDLGYGICLAVRCVILPQIEEVLLAAALDNSSIELYSTCSENLQFSKVEVLKGHEDWVRGLDFCVEKDGDLILASSSQDCFVRLWRFSLAEDQTDDDTYITINQQAYKVSLIGILTGHEGWVYSAAWHPCGQKLLTASIDKTMILWEIDPETNLWLENMRVGEVGGNTLGFYGGMFSPEGSSILGHSYHGAFHIWNCDEKSLFWTPSVTVGGHFGEVLDLGWEPNGAFIVSLSADQTTRIHAPWVQNNSSNTTWHEIARPQVHGYDLSSLAILSRYKFASSAEEKVIRAFQAPTNFRENFIRICDVDDEELLSNSEEVCAKGASVPSLGLSNKAVYENDNKEAAKVKNKEIYPNESHFTATILTEPPTEETLIQNTLWPEIQKLYGHGYEVYCLTANSGGTLVASACKATTSEHAAVLLWDTSNWKCVQKLVSHTLTVVQLAFSPNSTHLLSVSRDRRWSVFTLNPDTKLFELEATTNKVTGIHSRIIWCCSWSHDSTYFGTGSRDGKIVLWKRNAEMQDDSKDLIGKYVPACDFLELKRDSVTALCFAPDLVGGDYLICAGLENGVIHLYKWRNNWTLIAAIDNSFAHHLTVRRLAFRPKFGRAGDKSGDKNVLQLASCSSDHSLRVYDIKLDNL